MGWSHKYKMLLEEYDSLDCIVDLESNNINPEKDLKIFFDHNKHNETKNRLNKIIPNQKVKTINMWDDIFKFVTRSS